MILLGKIGGKEVALRHKHDLENLCHYETKLLVRGTIKALTGRNPSKLGFPIEYKGYFESEFNRLPNYIDKYEKDILLHRSRIVSSLTVGYTALPIQQNQRQVSASIN